MESLGVLCSFKVDLTSVFEHECDLSRMTCRLDTPTHVSLFVRICLSYLFFDICPFIVTQTMHFSAYLNHTHVIKGKYYVPL